MSRSAKRAASSTLRAKNDRPWRAKNAAFSVSTPGMAIVCTSGTPSMAASELEMPPALLSSTSAACM